MEQISRFHACTQPLKSLKSEIHPPVNFKKEIHIGFLLFLLNVFNCILNIFWRFLTILESVDKMADESGLNLCQESQQGRKCPFPAVTAIVNYDNTPTTLL